MAGGGGVRVNYFAQKFGFARKNNVFNINERREAATKAVRRIRGCDVLEEVSS